MSAVWNNSILPCSLRFIQCLVSSPNQSFKTNQIVFSRAGNSNAYGKANKTIYIVIILTCNLAANFLGNLNRLTFSRMRQNNAKFLSAEPSHQIFFSRVGTKHKTDVLERFVSKLMPILIVDLFKIININ